MDDNVDAAGTLAEGLSAHGHEVKTAYTAQAALQTRGIWMLPFSISDCPTSAGMNSLT
ncbi:CheY-like chemotaxis protein [Massilia sp. UYP11]|uniref:hypothetical protein n=1 Tax=Massilia sp. UYP11 TaxID=1756385 RepID=UPI003D1B1C48